MASFTCFFWPEVCFEVNYVCIIPSNFVEASNDYMIQLPQTMKVFCIRRYFSLSITGFCLSPVCPEAGGQRTEREEDQGEESCQEGEAQRYNILYFLMDKSSAENQESVNQRRLNEKTGNYAYPVQNKWAARGPQCVLRTLSIVHLRRLFTLILLSIWWAEPMLFVSLLIHRAIHTSL